MTIQDLRYLVAYTLPLFTICGLYFGGLWAYGAPFLAFVFIPLYELYFSPQGPNLTETEKERKANDTYFDWLLYSHVPILFFLIGWFLQRIDEGSLLFYEQIGLTVSLGIMIGVFGINVGHELGHRKADYERVLARMLLLPALYMHFYVEHNHGHHRHVSTREDPATARLNESIYFFWMRSTIMGYLGAWQIEHKRLSKQGKAFISMANQMIVFLILQLTYLSFIFLFLGLKAMIFAVLIAIIGFILLECINYIEHYGLLRAKQENGRYQKVVEMHSWDCNYRLGRIFLYELTRHAHHHHKASIKYQLLDYSPSSPQMPTGYPGMIILALIPPLFFKVMNPRVPLHMRNLAN